MSTEIYNSIYNSIFLHGFRATGKSTIGKLLAKQLDWKYVDMDEELEKRAGMTIPELTKNGTDWKQMRQMESELFTELIGTTNLVVSTGGGVCVNDIIDKDGQTFGQINTKIAQQSKNTLHIVLTAYIDTIINRIKKDELAKIETTRPILDEQKAKQVQVNLKQYPEDEKKQKEILVKEILEDVVAAYTVRKPLYEKISPYIIHTDFLSPDQVVQEILHIFNQNYQNHQNNMINTTSTDNITAKTKICIIIGDPVEHSLSPQIHNAAYRKLGIDRDFVFVAARTKLEDLKDVVQAVRAMGIRGLTCTTPHKLEVMKYLDWIDPVAQKIGAVNTVVNDDGILKGYNTDWLGVVVPLQKITNLQDKKVALIGAGGAARAIAYGLVENGAILKIYNRTLSKAEELAKELGCWAGSLDELAEIIDAEIIINATSIGMGEQQEKLPIDKAIIRSHHICFDIVYNPYETKFLQVAKTKGATIIHGIEMLLHQGMAQFTYYTGKEAPEEVMRQTLLECFGLAAN